MPEVNENYLIPAGFLYNYFLAFCITVFGNYLAPIFIIQTLIVLMTIWMTFKYFKDEMESDLHFLFLSGLILFAIIDIYKHYTFLMLSENVAILLVMLFFIHFKSALQTAHLKNYLLAALFLGLSALARPTLYPFLVLFVLLFILFTVLHKNSPMKVMFFLIFFLVVISLLPIRNYFITGDFKWLPANGSFVEYMKLANPFSFNTNPGEFMLYYFKKLMFCFGLLPVLEPIFQIRPHWIVLWIGIFLYIKNQHKMTNQIHAYAILFVVVFVTVLILIAPV